MTSFSERLGITPPRDAVQLDSMDAALRIGLWNVLTEVYFGFTQEEFRGRFRVTVARAPLNRAARSIWRNFLKRPVDELPGDWPRMLAELRTYFFGAPWNRVYDLLDFFPGAINEAAANERFCRGCNLILEREMSAYRFVDGTLARVTDPAEVAAVEEALALPGGYALASQHLATALAHLSNREAPDYRNSIKESISAVESVAAFVTGQDKARLGTALATLERTSGLHPALKGAFLSLYSYTNEDNGIRHALMQEPDLTHDDAKLMLVLCSAFVNYVKAITASGE